jgi:integrase
MPGGGDGDLKSATTPAITGTPNGNDYPSGRTTTYTYSKGFAEMELGSNLVHRGKAWWLVYAPEVTKNRRLLEVPFPEALLPWLAKYLDDYRPLLAGNRYRGDRVWVSMHYRALWRGTIYQKIMWLTERAFGRGLSPHPFRDCLATSLAIHDPAIVNTAHVMLGNSLATTERFYNLAQTLEAGRAVNRALTSLRDRLQAKVCDCETHKG